MFTSSLLFPCLRRSLAGVAVVSAAGLLAGAQTPAQPPDQLTAQPTAASAVQPGLVSSAPRGALASAFPAQPWSLPTSALSSDAEAQGYSSSADTAARYDAQQTAETQLASVEKFKMPGANAFQYGQRRRYGAPRYRGGNTNADGSEKYTVYAGAGFTLPAGSNSDYLDPSWSFQVGVGRNLNKHLGLGVQFDWDNFGVSGATINDYANTIAGDPTNQNGFGAHSHIWSITLNPTYQIYSGPGLGAYIVVGGGFYHKETTFTLPEIGGGYDYYGYPYEYEVNVPVQNYTSNSAGVNGGLGLTYKFSRFSNERLFAEIRAVHTFNEYRPGSIINDDGSVSGWNFFPQNSETTTYFPVKFGIRF